MEKGENGKIAVYEILKKKGKQKLEDSKENIDVMRGEKQKKERDIKYKNGCRLSKNQC